MRCVALLICRSHWLPTITILLIWRRTTHITIRSNDLSNVCGLCREYFSNLSVQFVFVCCADVFFLQFGHCIDMCFVVIRCRRCCRRQRVNATRSVWNIAHTKICRANFLHRGGFGAYEDRACHHSAVERQLVRMWSIHKHILDARILHKSLYHTTNLTLAFAHTRNTNIYISTVLNSVCLCIQFCCVLLGACASVVAVAPSSVYD